MVDRKARDQYSELLRHFASGRISDQAYLERSEPLEDMDDRGIVVIENESVYLVKDENELRLIGLDRLRAVDRKTVDRKTVARWILFLQTDLEYAWPLMPSEILSGIVFFLFVLVLCSAVISIFDWSVAGFALYGLAAILFLAVACFLLSPFENRWRAAQGYEELWPFRWPDELKEARRHPRLLAGKRNP